MINGKIFQIYQKQGSLLPYVSLMKIGCLVSEDLTNLIKCQIRSIDLTLIPILAQINGK